MKRLIADRPGWQRVPESDFHIVSVQTPEFTGSLTLLQLLHVTEPLWKRIGERDYCLAASGYQWMQHWPAGTHYSLTTMFDRDNRIVQWYIDICRRQGVDDRGVPWLDDLYLDLAIVPPRDVHLLDANELADALRHGIVSRSEYDLAWTEAERLMDGLTRGEPSLCDLSEAHLGRYFPG